MWNYTLYGYNISCKYNNVEGNILNLLEYSFDNAVSRSVDEIYQTIRMNINNMKNLEF